LEYFRQSGQATNELLWEKNKKQTMFNDCSFNVYIVATDTEKQKNGIRFVPVKHKFR